MRNIQVSEETADSFRVSWLPAPGDVIRYQLTYAPVGDLSSSLVTGTVGPDTTIVLTELQPQTTYRVTVTPEYRSGPGLPLQTEGTTREGWCGFTFCNDKASFSYQGTVAAEAVELGGSQQVRPSLFWGKAVERPSISSILWCLIFTKSRRRGFSRFCLW